MPEVWRQPACEQFCNHAIIDNKPCVFKTRVQRYPCSQSDGIVLVYDVSNRSSFSGIRQYHDQLRQDHQRVTHNTNSPVRFERLPIMIVGSKADLASERAVSIEEGTALAKELGCGFVETSATQGINIEKAFYDIIRARRILDKEDRASKPMFKMSSFRKPMLKKPIRETLVSKTLTFHRRCGKGVSLMRELSIELAKETLEYLRERKRKGITFWGVIKEVGELIKGLAQATVILLIWAGIFVFRIKVTCVRNKGGLDGCEFHPD